MQNPMFLTLLIFCVTSLSCCSVEGNADDDSPDSTEVDSEFIRNIKSVVASIESYSDSTPDCNGDYESTDINASRCNITTYSVYNTLAPHFAANFENTDSLGQRILVIDSGMAGSAIRYPNRILGIYQWDDHYPDIGYENSTATTDMREGMFHVKNVLLGESSHFVPSSELTRYLNQAPFNRLTSNTVSTNVHGDISLNLLADYNPDAQFVLLESFHFNHADAVCSETGIIAYSSAIKNAVTDLVEAFDIDYIHLSAGANKSYFENLATTLCGSYEDWLIQSLQHAYADILQTFANSALLFQASVGGVTTVITNAANDGDYWHDHYSDCVTIENRLRSGFLTKNTNDGFSLPSDGLSYTQGKSHLSDTQQKIHRCNDVYLNVGWNENFADLPSFGDHPVLFSSDGISAGPLNFMSSSFINPVALSWVNYLAAGDSDSARQIINAMVEAAGHEPSLKDPMYYHSFMLCRDYPDACRGWDEFEYSQ